MTLLPVIHRELLAEARRGLNYWLRLLGALVVLLLFCFLDGITEMNLYSGLTLFGKLNNALIISIWILVPLMTADCISREKREGTLGLLFLTPLKAREIVMAKSIVHLLRAFTLLAAAIPVVLLPVLAGGVSGRVAFNCLLFHFYAASMAVAGSLIASALSTSWWRAHVAAVAWVAGLAWLTSSGALVVFFIETNEFPPPGPAWLVGAWIMSAMGPGLLAEVDAYAHQPLTSAVLHLCLLLAAAGLAGILFGTRFAAHTLRRHWKEASQSPRLLSVERRLSEPLVATAWLRAALSRALDRNPIGWLHQRTTNARLGKWGVCLALVVVETMLIAADLSLWVDAQMWICTGFQVFITIAAAASFLQERENGALELLLVTPLRERDLIWGRLRGVWRMLLPSVVVMAMMLFMLGNMATWRWRAGISAGALAMDLGAGVISLPIIGLYFSLRCRSFFAAWLATMAFALVPMTLFWMAQAVLEMNARSGPFIAPANEFTIIFGWSVLPSLFLGGFFLHLALKHLRQRRFVLHGG